ncbi:hypothetical protein MK407_02205 [Streptococcus sanguinis]|uniref:hypothetical protein n=1 Tax=Streptococcus sanguinis TaxID=1305 RepID=UPI001CBB6377|nr:hypothetical protein [Streptococcus sanguinis]MBZ2022491.1 hypothetical protein [Streptococcus sanguinis]MBZ2047189.1 hypothetical protein [Streptococcus sanguinis]MBZ2050116.1 hypothetical protein [Streptococcus sanguinis]MBZ2058758.1 hypothetical protein [Streptococcus sanguinis]MCC3177955.1 hypothetical protein [Streptococcus sanguinis]
MKLSKKSKLIIVVLLLLMFLPYLAYQGYVAYYITPYYKITLKKKIQSYQFIENNNALVMKWSYENPLDYWLTKANKRLYPQDARVGGSKIVQEYQKLNRNGNIHNVAEGQEYWGITVYNTKGGKLTSKDYDIFKMVREYDSDAVPSRIQNTVYVSKGRELLDIYLKTSANNYTDGFLKSIDLNSGKIVEAGDEQDKWTAESSSYFSQLLPLSSDYFLHNSGLYLNKGKKLASAALIRQKYPKSAALLEDENGMIAILTDKPDFENSLSFLQLLYKKGVNLFENVTIPADSSIDGQEHIVNSQEEFVKYYNFEQVSPSKK